jgi:hypothetical protein
MLHRYQLFIVIRDYFLENYEYTQSDLDGLYLSIWREYSRLNFRHHTIYPMLMTLSQKIMLDQFK